MRDTTQSINSNTLNSLKYVDEDSFIVYFDRPETAADIISAALAAYDAGLYELPDSTVQSAADLLDRISWQL